MSLFRDFAERVRDAFSGGGSSRSDSDQSPSRSPRPQQRPSIMTVGSQRVATRDMPQFGVSAGDRTDEPSYSAFSLRGLTSTDPANVMRNIQGAERMARVSSGTDRGDRPERAQTPAIAISPVPPTVIEPPAPAPAPAPPVETETGMTPQQEQRIEAAGEAAAEQQRKLGLAQTIATSPSGLLSTGEATRRRRSLIGGGLIA